MPAGSTEEQVEIVNTSEVPLVIGDHNMLEAIGQLELTVVSLEDSTLDVGPGSRITKSLYYI